MALEIPNAIHAAGSFVGVTPVPSPFASVPPVAGDNIIESNGFRSFTYVSTGVYKAILEQSIGGAESVVMVSGPKNFAGTIQAQVNVTTDPDVSALNINAYDENNNPVDLLFFSVLVIKVPGSKSLELPILDAPLPGGPGMNFGTALTGAPAYPANLLLPGVINTVDKSGGNVTVYLPRTALEGAVAGAKRVIKETSFAATHTITINAGPFGVEDPSVAPATAPAGTAVIAATPAAGLYLVLQFDGANWLAVGQGV